MLVDKASATDVVIERDVGCSHRPKQKRNRKSSSNSIDNISALSQPKQLSTNSVPLVYGDEGDWNFFLETVKVKSEMPRNGYNGYDSVTAVAWRRVMFNSHSWIASERSPFNCGVRHRSSRDAEMYSLPRSIRSEIKKTCDVGAVSNLNRWKGQVCECGRDELSLWAGIWWFKAYRVDQILLEKMLVPFSTCDAKLTFIDLVLGLKIKRFRSYPAVYIDINACRKP